jgi:hypothetical protein
MSNKDLRRVREAPAKPPSHQAERASKQPYATEVEDYSAQNLVKPEAKPEEIPAGDLNASNDE